MEDFDAFDGSAIITTEHPARFILLTDASVITLLISDTSVPATFTVNFTFTSTDVPFLPVTTNVTSVSPASDVLPVILPSASTSPSGSFEPLFTLYCISVPYDEVVSPVTSSAVRSYTGSSAV